MNILYILTIISVYILLMLIHKSEQKQNIITWLAISVILIICYNILICLICTFIGLLCTLFNLSICNIITIVLLLAILLKSKKVQKYYIKVQDIIFSILLLIIVIFIAYKQYGYPFNIKYTITDGSSHYFFAQQFYENSTLLYNDTTDDLLGLYASDFRLPGAYINEGIVFKIFDGVISKIDLFVLFDIFILYLSGILFYQLIKKENKKSNILAMIFALTYMLGYQLNSMLYGYVYLSLALDIIIGLLLITKQEKIFNTIILPMLSLVSFGIFFSYAYFIPIIYIAIIVNLIIKSTKNQEKIITVKNIIEIMYTIIMPLLLGTAYFIIFPLINGGKTEISTLGTAGEIYENYITNYLAFVPLFIVSVVLLIKKKEKKIESSFSIILFVLSIIFTIILWIGNKLEIVSQYYFFKAYYIIWPLVIYTLYIAISYILAQKNRVLTIITYTYISIYLLAIILATIIFNKNIYINDIFYNNKQNVIEDTKILETGEINILKEAEKSLQYDDIYILSPLYRGRAAWISVLYHNQLMYIDWMTGYTISIQDWLEEKKEKYYLAYYYDYDKRELEYPTEENNKYKIIYNDEYGFILERK